jgi:hypothetical protein
MADLKKIMPKRIKNVSVLDMSLATDRLTVWRKKYEPDRVSDVLTTFFVAVDAKIQDTSGNALSLSQIKARNRITVDYTRDNDGRLVVSDIIVTSKSQRGGEGGWLK